MLLLTTSAEAENDSAFWGQLQTRDLEACIAPHAGVAEGHRAASVSATLRSAPQRSVCTLSLCPFLPTVIPLVSSNSSNHSVSSILGLCIGNTAVLLNC